ncbi:evolutionarily conserved signaling intermediate in Toll pathway, mitochondrial [Passer domesticus]|uniref:evolutionarily conserved signaling intermediate in Toll pathway, mitochondrial n=1 Tax=Passer domesticus TaxID=48849 RepID=UPI0030FE7CF0
MAAPSGATRAGDAGQRDTGTAGHRHAAGLGPRRPARRLWGGAGAHELCRSLCQRPARVPSGGTPKPDRARSRDPEQGDTDQGDTSGGHSSRGATSGGATSGGATSGGDTSRGDTLWGATLEGDTSRDGSSRGDTPWGDTSGGDTSGGDASGGDTLGGDTLGGDTSGGDASGGATPKAPVRHLRWYRSQHKRGRGDPGGDPGDPGDPSGDPGGDPGDPGAAFVAALRQLAQAPPGRGGRLALVEAALAALEARGAARSLPAYNALLRLLPRGPWLPRGLQRLLWPFPRQQECGLRLLEQMERHGVMPDAETRFLLLGVFGPRSRPVRKLQRMQFWLPRLRHLDPHPLPPRLPPGLAAARLGLQRIACDPGATVTVVQPPVPDSGDDEGSVQPFILSCQSPEQRELLARHGPARPVFVEGPFPLWLRGTLLKYFVLRGDPLPPHLRDPPPDPERSLYFPLRLELELERGPWDDDGFAVEPAQEGPVLALCVPGAPGRRALARWIAALQRHNPALARTPVLFRLGPGAPPPPGPPPAARLGPGGPPEPPERGSGEGETPGRSGGE